MEQRVIELFHQSIEAKMNAGEVLAPQLVAASQWAVNSLLQEGKLLCCGSGASANMAGILCQNLLHQYKLERPGFPAINLAADSGLLSGIADHSHYGEVFARQISTLGNSDDLLVLFSTGEDSSSTIQAVQAAHSRGLPVICFSAESDHNLRSLLTEDDVDLCIPPSDPHRIQEVQLLSLFALCDLIDQPLFGGID